MTELIERNRLHMWFDSMQEMRTELPALLKRNPINHKLHTSWPWQRTVLPQVFYDTGSYKEAFEKCENGWPEMLTRLQPMIGALRGSLDLSDVEAIQLKARRRKRQRSDHGDVLDIHRIWNGDFERAWERPVKTTRNIYSERYASIFVDLGMHFGQHTNESLWRAALSVCLVDTLTRMSINTEVWSGSTGCNAYKEFDAPYIKTHAVRIKEYTQPVNEERLAALCHAAFFRTWDFSMTMASKFTTDIGLGNSQEFGLPYVLEQRQAAGERVFKIKQIYSEYAAKQELHRIIQVLSEKEAA